MALALRAAFGVRVCNPANAVAKRYPGAGAFVLQGVMVKALDYSRHPWRSPRAAGACPGLDPGAFAFAILQTPSGLRRN